MLGGHLYHGAKITSRRKGQNSPPTGQCAGTALSIPEGTPQREGCPGRYDWNEDSRRGSGVQRASCESGEIWFESLVAAPKRDAVKCKAVLKSLR